MCHSAPPVACHGCYTAVLSGDGYALVCCIDSYRQDCFFNHNFNPCFLVMVAGPCACTL